MWPLRPEGGQILQVFTRHRRPLAVALTTLGVTLVAAAPALAHARVAHAAGFLPSITRLTTSSTDVLPDGSVTLTATVRPGFLVEAPATVTFADTTTGAALGSVPVTATCYLVSGPCQIQTDVDSSSLAAGVNIVTATYSGDRWERSSAGTVLLFQETQTTTDGVTTTDCGYDCDTGVQTSSDETTNLDISAPAGPNATITDSFTTDPLPCTTSGGGDTVIFSATGLDANKIVFLQAVGTSAETLFDIYDGGEHVCFEQPRPFTTQYGSPPATIDPATGLYAGILPPCEERGGGDGTRNGPWGHALNPPCEDFAEFDTGGDDGIDLYNQQFETSASDPRASN